MVTQTLNKDDTLHLITAQGYRRVTSNKLLDLSAQLHSFADQEESRAAEDFRQSLYDSPTILVFPLGELLNPAMGGFWAVAKLTNAVGTWHGEMPTGLAAQRLGGCISVYNRSMYDAILQMRHSGIFRIAVYRKETNGRNKAS